MQLCLFSVPSVSISGDKEMHVEAGSSVVLKCSVKGFLASDGGRPNHIWWYRDKERLLDGVNGVSVEDNVDFNSQTTSKSLAPSWHQQQDSATSLYSILTVKEASSKFSGKYSCVPDNCRPASINVHVILGRFLRYHLNPNLHTNEFSVGYP